MLREKAIDVVVAETRLEHTQDVSFRTQHHNAIHNRHKKVTRDISTFVGRGGDRPREADSHCKLRGANRPP